MKSKTRAWQEVVRFLPLEKSIASCSSRSVTPGTPSVIPEPQPSSTKTTLPATVSETLTSDFSIHKPHTDDALSESECSTLCSTVPSTVLSSENAASNQNAQVLVNCLLARIEALEAENEQLKEHNSTKTGPNCNKKLTISDIAANDGLVKLYTSFQFHEDFMPFYEFLGPAVEELKYWEYKEFTRKRHRKRKLESLDQLLLTLMKLKLNIRNMDIAFHFGISESLVSRYICTWVCFLYQHMKEIEWTPTQQVAATLPYDFRKKYPPTFAILNGSQIFLETPSELYLQSSIWSS